MASGRAADDPRPLSETMNKALSLISSLLILAGAAGAAHAQEVKAGDPVKGAAKAAMCIGCHNISGYQASFPEVYKVPKISGQGGKYIVAALSAYAKGERKHPSMRAIAETLSEQDMADLAAFYEQNGKSAGAAAPTAPAVLPDALKDRLAACVACHGATFSTPIDAAYPKLAGQHADYLYHSLKAYATDNNPRIGRANPTMRSQVVQEAAGARKPTFTNAELKQIAKWLESLPGELKTVEASRVR
jgi:cytochrome c553